MNFCRKAGNNGSEAGAALLIAIFALLLISVIAIALVVSSGTDSALAGNYRTSTEAYYAAVAGAEEARGRLLWKNPDYINNPTLLSPQGLPTWGLTQVLYIVNPALGETVDPEGGNPANYADTEYQPEFGWPLAGTIVTKIPSVSPDGISNPPLPGGQYKWVRITAVTEKSLGVDVDGDGSQDITTLLYYDPAHVDAFNNLKPGLIAPVIAPPTAVQALQITSLSVTPGGSRRLLQYVVAPLMVSSSNSAGGSAFPGALTLAGSGVIFQDPGAAGYKINGKDGCSVATPPVAVQSIAYTNPLDFASIQAQAISNNPGNYPGFPMVLTGPAPGTWVPTSPSIQVPPLPTPSPIRQTWQNPLTLDGVVQDITKSADVVINGPATGSDITNLAPTMSALNPQTLVINGDLNLSGWHNTGNGLLLVTGTLNYDPDASWNGVVLVIGQGVFSSSKNGVGGINGSVFIAKTRDGSGNLLSTLGPAFFGSLSSYGSNPGFGINYASCAGQSPLGQSALGPLSYKVLSFREIALTN